MQSSRIHPLRHPIRAREDDHVLSDFFCEICRARRPGRKFFTPVDRQEKENWLIRLNLPTERTAVLKNRMDLRQVALCGMHFPPEVMDDDRVDLIPTDMSVRDNQLMFNRIEASEAPFQVGNGKQLLLNEFFAADEVLRPRSSQTNLRGRPTRKNEPISKAPKRIGAYQYRQLGHQPSQSMYPHLRLRRPNMQLPYEKLPESQYVLSILHLVEASGLEYENELTYPERSVPIMLRNEAKSQDKTYVCAACSVMRRGPKYVLPPPGKRRNEWINRLALSRKEWIEPLVTKPGLLCGFHFDAQVTLGGLYDPDPYPLDMREAINRLLFRDLYDGTMKVITPQGLLVRASFFFMDEVQSIETASEAIMERIDPEDIRFTEARQHDGTIQRRYRTADGAEYVAMNEEEVDEEYAETVENAAEHIIEDPETADDVLIDEEGNMVNEEYIVYGREVGGANTVVEQRHQHGYLQRQHPTYSTRTEKSTHMAENVRPSTSYQHPPNNINLRTGIRQQPMERPLRGGQKRSATAAMHPSQRLRITPEEYDGPGTVVAKEEEVVEEEEEVTTTPQSPHQEHFMVNVEDFDDGDMVWEGDGAGPSYTYDPIPHKKYAIRYHKCMICGEKRVNLDMQSISAKIEKRQILWKNLHFEVDPDVIFDLESKARSGQSIPICRTHFPPELRMERVRHIEDTIFPDGRMVLSCLICGMLGPATLFCQMTKDGQSMHRLFTKTQLPHQQQEILRTMVHNNELALVCTVHYDETVRPNALFLGEADDQIQHLQDITEARKKPHRRLEYHRQTVNCVLCRQAVPRPSTKKMPSHERAMQLIFDYADVPLPLQRQVLDEVRRKTTHVPACRKHFPPEIRELRGRYWYRKMEKLIQQGRYDGLQTTNGTRALVLPTDEGYREDAYEQPEMEEEEEIEEEEIDDWALRKGDPTLAPPAASQDKREYTARSRYLRLFLNNSSVKSLVGLMGCYGTDFWYSLNMKVKELGNPQDVPTFCELQGLLDHFKPSSFTHHKFWLVEGGRYEARDKFLQSPTVRSMEMLQLIFSYVGDVGCLSHIRAKTLLLAMAKQRDIRDWPILLHFVSSRVLGWLEGKEELDAFQLFIIDFDPIRQLLSHYLDNLVLSPTIGWIDRTYPGMYLIGRATDGQALLAYTHSVEGNFLLLRCDYNFRRGRCLGSYQQNGRTLRNIAELMEKWEQQMKRNPKRVRDVKAKLKKECAKFNEYNKGATTMDLMTDSLWRSKEQRGVSWGAQTFHLLRDPAYPLDASVRHAYAFTKAYEERGVLPEIDEFKPPCEAAIKEWNCLFNQYITDYGS
ncbi:unnamed protein product, partial [Mesorhabditis spiculigera]